MIDYEDFKGMCDRVARVTGRIDEETRRVYYEALKDTKRDVVFMAMRKVAKEHGYYRFPTLAEVHDAIRECSDAGPKMVPTWCVKCNMTGMILAEKGGYTSAFRCDCENGKHVSRRIRRFSEVAGLYAADMEPEPQFLQVVRVEDLPEAPDGETFPHGAAVEKTCSTCWTPFKFEHFGEQTAKDLKAAHLGRESLCEACYVNGGRERGLWK